MSIRKVHSPSHLPFFLFFSESCWGEAMATYTKPRQWKKEESERPRGERDQIKCIDLRLERWQAIRFRKAGRRQDVPQVASSWGE